MQTTYLPMDPPPGHGPHRYAFQVFATDRVLELGTAPGRGKLERELREHVVAKGYLIGVYTRF